MAAETYLPIHRPAPSFAEQAATEELLEPALKSSI